MTRGAPALCAVLAALLAACGGAADGPAASAAPVDSALVDALADLHLADARTALDTASTAQEAATRRRAGALRRHGLTDAALARRLAALAERPEEASATYLALETRLQMERQGATP